MKTAILSYLLAITSAKVTFFGTCVTDYTTSSMTVSNLASNYWYETYRDTFNPSFITTDCSTQQYKTTSDSSILDAYWRGFSVIYLFTGFYATESGQIKCDSSNGKCYVNFWTWLDSDMNKDANYISLTMSAGSYFVSWQCDAWFLGMAIDEQATLLTNSNSASSAQQSAAKTIIDNNFSSYSYSDNVVENKQSDCTYTW